MYLYSRRARHRQADLGSLGHAHDPVRHGNHDGNYPWDSDSDANESDEEDPEVEPRSR